MKSPKERFLEAAARLAERLPLDDLPPDATDLEILEAATRLQKAASEDALVQLYVELDALDNENKDD